MILFGFRSSISKGSRYVFFVGRVQASFILGGKSHHWYSLGCSAAANGRVTGLTQPRNKTILEKGECDWVRAVREHPKSRYRTLRVVFTCIFLFFVVSLDPLRTSGCFRVLEWGSSCFIT